jgi:hypothetical protein
MAAQFYRVTRAATGGGSERSSSRSLWKPYAIKGRKHGRPSRKPNGIR